MYTVLSGSFLLVKPTQAAGGRTERMAPARRHLPLVLLVTLLACASAAAAEWTVCDDANCGKGHCAEVKGIIPMYKCECDPGWSKAIEFFDMSPCVIPHCTFDSACFNLSLELPRGIPITDICVAVSCGPGGTCKNGGGGLFSGWTCECQPGYVNVLNLTAFPCVKHCEFGKDCTPLGLGPPPSPPPSPAPPGPVPLQSWLLLVVLLVSMAVVQVV